MIGPSWIPVAKYSKKLSFLVPNDHCRCRCRYGFSWTKKTSADWCGGHRRDVDVGAVSNTNFPSLLDRATNWINPACCKILSCLIPILWTVVILLAELIAREESNYSSGVLDNKKYLVCCLCSSKIRTLNGFSNHNQIINIVLVSALKLMSLDGICRLVNIINPRWKYLSETLPRTLLIFCVHLRMLTVLSRTEEFSKWPKKYCTIQSHGTNCTAALLMTRRYNNIISSLYPCDWLASVFHVLLFHRRRRFCSFSIYFIIFYYH